LQTFGQQSAAAIRALAERAPVAARAAEGGKSLSGECHKPMNSAIEGEDIELASRVFPE
jgi:hypothetical protein